MLIRCRGEALARALRQSLGGAGSGGGGSDGGGGSGAGDALPEDPFGQLPSAARGKGHCFAGVSIAATAAAPPAVATASAAAGAATATAAPEAVARAVAALDALMPGFSRGLLGF